MRAKQIFVVLLLLALCGCATVPKEVVELSYYMGDDLEALQQSYDDLIHEFYGQLRAKRLDYLENEWTPLFLEIWIEDGKLVEVARGDLVWSDEEDDFVAPTPGSEHHQLLATINGWSQDAIYEIEKKRGELLTPLNLQEDSLRDSVWTAFRNLIRANAAVTQHLNSIRKVHELQDDVLSELRLKDLRDWINNTLDSASQKAEEGLEKIREAGRP